MPVGVLSKKPFQNYMGLVRELTALDRPSEKIYSIGSHTLVG